MKNNILAVATVISGLAVGLANCGTSSPNSDIGLVHVAGVKTIAPVADVAIVPTGPAPASDNQKVVGTSCKNKAWDPAPSKDNAINLMKRQAAERGYNAVYSVDVKPDPSPMMKNCWSALIASGIAFKRG
jgi:uncharacterized protein YbjQ (UPF0145 family)